MAQTERAQITQVEPAGGQDAVVNDFVHKLDGEYCTLVVLDRDLGTPPGSPSDGDIYIVRSTPTGAWVGHEDDIALYYNGWIYVTPQTGWRVILLDEASARHMWDGSAWVEDDVYGVPVNGMTASTTQTQAAGTVITTKLAVFGTVSNANDAATLSPAYDGKECIVANDGANTLQIFPAVGDSIDGGSVDASTTLAAGDRQWFVAQSATDWLMVP